MPTALAWQHDTDGVMRLLGGSVAMLSGAFGMTLFVADRRDTSPGLRAFASAAPIAIAVLVMRLLGREELAIGIIFGTSVAMLSTVVGSVCAVAPIGPAPGRWRRLWSFSVAGALIAFVAGFAGRINWWSALVLMAEGALVLWLWRDAAVHQLGLNDAASSPASPGRLQPSAGMAALLAMGSLLLVAAGAGIARYGAVVFSAQPRHVPTGLLGATMLSLALIMPAMHSGRRLALAGLSWVPMTSQVGVVLINLCLLLPLLALAPYATAYGWAAFHAATPDLPNIAPHLLAFPLAVWRVDALLVVILSVLFLPVSMGRWNLGKEEGMLLVIVYFVYLIAATASANGLG